LFIEVRLAPDYRAKTRFRQPPRRSSRCCRPVPLRIIPHHGVDRNPLRTRRFAARPATGI